MSGYFYAIGGANYDKNEGLKIDLDIIKETKKNNPNVLLIAAASNDDLKKINAFTEYYEKLGAKVNVLYSYNMDISLDEISNAISISDIIYLSGGITARLLEFAKKYNLHILLKNAYKSGKIIVGVSAGAILFFDYGYGDKDAYLFNLETVNHQITQGLGIFEGIFCPHYQNNGLLSFHEEIKKYPLDGYALENGAALKINDEGFKIIKDKGCSAFRFNKDNNYLLEYLKDNHVYNINLFK